MGRIRSVKPEIRIDDTVASWPREVRLAWIYLWGYLDDEGRGRDNLALLRADLFPLDRDVTEKKLDEWLTLMATSLGEAGEAPLCRYEVDGRRYLHAVRWKQHQRINRPSPSRLPPCTLTHPSVRDHGGITEGSPPRARAGAPADQGSGKGSGISQGSTDLTRVQKRLNCDAGYAERTARDVLSKAPATVLNPTAYVLAAIDADPERYRPTLTAPRFALCDHGIPPGACPDCIEAAAR